MPKNKLFYVLLSVAVSVILIWFLLSQIESQDLVQTFSRIHYPTLCAYMAISLMGAGLRAWRYRWLLLPYQISWRDILLVTFIRNLFVDLFPSRLGSLSYIYLLNKRLYFSFEAATSTFLMAVIFDFITLSPFLLVSIFAVGFHSSPLPFSTLILLSLLFFMVIFLILWKITQIFSFLLRAYEVLLKAFKKESKRWAKITVEKIRLTTECLFEIKKRKILWPLFSLSLFIRLAKYISIYFLFVSLLRSFGFSFKQISFWKTILGTTGAELTSALPIKGIGGFGTWESAWALTFRLMNFEPRLAIISGIGVHLIANLFEYSLGIAAILLLALPFMRKIIKKPQKT
ncbi:MAG: lysylphosphatidylglycerol synthase transmembrane domain-containing protein [Candidatus Aminicenantes bacterium]